MVFASVNPDRDGDLAEEITGGGPIPQLVMFRKPTQGWVRKKLVGGQSVEAVEEFIKDGLASDKADKSNEQKGHRRTVPIRPPPGAEKPPGTTMCRGTAESSRAAATGGRGTAYE